MIKRLSNHIKKVLIQNQCCVLPFLGGFVCENIPAFRDTKKGLIMPPCSEIYFNKNLSYDDGSLQQSYASAYSLSMRRAKALLDNDMKCLRECLVKDKSVLLDGIGELTLSQDGIIGFDRIQQEYGDSPMYGLVPLVMNEPSSKEQNYHNGNDKYINIRISKKAINVAVAVVSILFVLLPLGEISVYDNNIYKAGVSVYHDSKSNKRVENKASVNESMTADADKSDAETTLSLPQNKEKKYHVIVASDKKEEKLHDYKTLLIQEGYTSTTILSGTNMNRVSIGSFETESEAYSLIRDLKKKSSKFNTAWVYKN